MGTFHLHLPIYTEHIGKPLYQFSKKHFGDSTYVALHVADLPGSIVTAGVAAAISYGMKEPVIEPSLFVFALHQVLTPSVLFYSHMRNVRERERSSLDHIVES